MTRNLLLAAFILLASASCKKQEITQDPKQELTENQVVDSAGEISGRRVYDRSGVVLTFDDRSVNEWYDLHKLIDRQYNWKATFFVSHFPLLSTDQVRKLRSLQNYGHEIAGHGLNHVDAIAYTQQNGAQNYIENEITPMLKAMRQNGLRVTNFAYPFGSRDQSTDLLLLKHFRVLRGTAYSDNVADVKNLRCYYSFDQNRVVNGLGIDEIYNNPIEYIKSVLQYAKANNKIVVLYAHQPVQSAASGQYQTSYAKIREICKYIKDNRMKFYSMEDLYGLR